MSAAVRAQPRPKFNSNGLHPELLRNPTFWAKLYFYLFPLFTFYHILLQSFFDFNAVFMLLQCVSLVEVMCCLRAHQDWQGRRVPQSDSTWCVRIWKELGTWSYRLYCLLAGLDHRSVCAL